MQDLMMLWISLEHKGDHAKVEKIEKYRFRETTLIFFYALESKVRVARR